MIAIICAMSEERDAFISLMKDIKLVKLENINYHGKPFDNKCYKGKLSGKDVVLVHSGVGKVYAAIVTTLVIKKFKPELVVNVGCAGSLNPKVHVNDVVIAKRVADWDVDVPDWDRSMVSDKMSFACDGRFIKLAKDTESKTKIKVGNIVSGDAFVSKKSQIKEIKKYFPLADCVEMEGASVANSCYAFGVNSVILRSISDETTTNDNYKTSEFNLKMVCDTAADICAKIIKRY